MSIVRFFDLLEDRIRAWLSKRPIMYGFVAGLGAVLFFRGVWLIADDLNMSSTASIAISLIILLLSGVFVSHFVGDQLILSGIKKEKKVIDKTEDEVRAEMGALQDIKQELKEIKEKIEEAQKEDKEHHQAGGKTLF